jgi:hypothetical protein
MFRFLCFFSALGGGRTLTPFGTWPSTMPVCQFQHQRKASGIIITN